MTKNERSMIPTLDQELRELGDTFVPVLGANYGIDISSPSPAIESSKLTPVALKELGDEVYRRALEMYDQDASVK